ncbi:hypothetical protein ACP275_07G098900 [Erythranthe tilingii]
MLPCHHHHHHLCPTENFAAAADSGGARRRGSSPELCPAVPATDAYRTPDPNLLRRLSPAVTRRWRRERSCRKPPYPSTRCGGSTTSRSTGCLSPAMLTFIVVSPIIINITSKTLL